MSQRVADLLLFILGLLVLAGGWYGLAILVERWPRGRRWSLKLGEAALQFALMLLMGIAVAVAIRAFRTLFTAP